MSANTLTGALGPPNGGHVTIVRDMCRPLSTPFLALAQALGALVEALGALVETLGALDETLHGLLDRLVSAPPALVELRHDQTCIACLEAPSWTGNGTLLVVQIS